MNTQKLTELVSANSTFNDINHPRYSDVKLKEKIWDKTGGKLNQSGMYAFLYVL
jgi:hypothetical protein